MDQIEKFKESIKIFPFNKPTMKGKIILPISKSQN